MDPLELLVRGTAALIVMALAMALGRARFRASGDDDAPADLGMD